MATYYSGASNGYRLRLDLTPGAQDINNNTTVLAWELLLENNSINRMQHYSTYSMTLDGTQRVNVSGAEHSVNINEYQTLSLRSGSVTLTHQPDGTRTVPFMAKFRVNQVEYYTPQTELSLSGNLTLTTIPRATTPVVSDMTMGQRSRINLPRASASFTHDVTYKFGQATGTIATGAGASVDWTPQLALASQVPNATFGTVTITVTTKSGATVIGTKTSTVRLNVPESVVPDVTYVEMTNYDPAIQTAFAGLVRYQSRAVVKVIANGVRGSTITKVDIKVGDKTYPAQRDGDWWVATTDVLTMSAGTHARGVEVTITDTRGRRATQYEPLTVLNWFPIVANRFDGFRSTPLGDQSDDGRSAFFGLIVQVASVGQKNKTSWYLEVQDPLTKEWSTLRYYEGATVESDTADYAQFLIDDYDFDPDYSYNARYTIEDFFHSITQYTTLPTSSNVLDFKANKKGMAIGKASEQDALEVAWDAHYTGDKLTHKGYDVVLKPEIDAIAQAVELQYVSGNVLDYAMTMTGRFQTIAVSAGTDVPSGYDYSSGIILKRAANNIIVTLYNRQDPSKMVNNVYYVSEWKGWKEPGAEPVEAVLTGDKFSTGDLKLHRIGRLCVTTGSFRFTQEIPTGSTHTLGSVPEGFRPLETVQTWSMSQSTREMVALGVQQNGMIVVYNYSTNPLPVNSNLTANLTWITND